MRLLLKSWRLFGVDLNRLGLSSTRLLRLLEKLSCEFFFPGFNELKNLLKQ
jgi:hypothetical protein